MNKKFYGLGALAGSAVLLATTASPASAADGDTVATFALAGSTLSISVQPTASLTDGAAGASSVSGQLGNVKVTDLRGGTVNWNANASSTRFTSAGGTQSTGVSYTAGAMTTTGNIVISPGTATALTATPTKVAGPTVVIGNNTAQWNPTVTVSLPSDALTGTYTGTITTSVN